MSCGVWCVPEYPGRLVRRSSDATKRPGRTDGCWTRRSGAGESRCTVVLERDRKDQDRQYFGPQLNITHAPIHFWANLRPPAHRSVTSVPQHPPWYSAGGPYTLEARHISATSTRTLQPGNEARPSTISTPQARGRAEMQMMTRTSCNPCARIRPKRAGRSPPALSADAHGRLQARAFESPREGWCPDQREGRLPTQCLGG